MHARLFLYLSSLRALDSATYHMGRLQGIVNAEIASENKENIFSSLSFYLREILQFPSTGARGYNRTPPNITRLRLARSQKYAATQQY